VSSEVATGIPRRGDRRSAGGHRAGRTLAVQLLGPLTILAGIVWAIAQPYRIAFLHPHGKGLYDFLAQPPLLVVLVGVIFALLIAPGLVQDLGKVERGPEG
jgi:ABC-type amino acid transport system permease subunit